MLLDRKALILFALLLLILAFTALPAMAHRMLIVRGGEPGTLQVIYEGGIPARRATVTLYNSYGEIVAQGPVDKDGYFYFEESLNPDKAEANDGMGHLARFDFVAVNEGKEFPLYWRVAGGLALLLLLAYIFRRGNLSLKKRN